MATSAIMKEKDLCLEDRDSEKFYFPISPSCYWLVINVTFSNMHYNSDYPTQVLPVHFYPEHSFAERVAQSATMVKVPRDQVQSNWSDLENAHVIIYID